MSFTNKIFVVTGANSGIGFAAAKYLVDEGAKVYITGRNLDAITKAATSLGRNAVGVVAEASSIADSAKLADIIAGNGDKLDGAFINAGFGLFAPVEAVDEAHFDAQFNVNVKGSFFTIQKLLPVLKDGSSIVLNGSNAAHIGTATASVYSATKAAINSLAKTLSKDLLPRRIRVNVVNPGATDTTALDKMGLPVEAVAGLKAQFASAVPIGRIAQPVEIANYVAFLLSDKSSFILGTELTVDGGMTQL